MTQRAAMNPDDEAVVLQWESSGHLQPQASIVLTTWQCEQFAEAAVRSALSQSVPFELVIRDDGSTDRTVDVVLSTIESSLGDGLATRVVVLRGLVNRGLGYNFTRAVRQCRCEWIFNFDGDDVSSPDRVALGLAEVATMADASALFARCVEAGDIESLPPFEDLRVGRLGTGEPVRAPIVGATMAIRRDVVDRFGPLPDRIVSHDNLLETRALLVGSVLQSDAVIVKRRKHEFNISRTIAGASAATDQERVQADLVRRLDDLARCVRSMPAAGLRADPRARATIDGMVLRVLHRWALGLGAPGSTGIRSLAGLLPFTTSRRTIAHLAFRLLARPVRSRWGRRRSDRMGAAGT
jgi:hypothetical protein